MTESPVAVAEAAKPAVPPKPVVMAPAKTPDKPEALAKVEPATPAKFEPVGSAKTDPLGPAGDGPPEPAPGAVFPASSGESHSLLGKLRAKKQVTIAASAVFSLLAGVAGVKLLWPAGDTKPADTPTQQLAGSNSKATSTPETPPPSPAVTIPPPATSNASSTPTVPMVTVVPSVPVPEPAKPSFGSPPTGLPEKKSDLYKFTDQTALALKNFVPDNVITSFSIALKDKVMAQAEFVKEIGLVLSRFQISADDKSKYQNDVLFFAKYTEPPAPSFGNLPVPPTSPTPTTGGGLLSPVPGAATAAKPGERYKITDQTISKLRGRFLPDPIVTAVSALKDREYAREEFEKEIDKALLPTQFSSSFKTIYKGEILEVAVVSTAPPAGSSGSAGPTATSFPTVVPPPPGAFSPSVPLPPPGVGVPAMGTTSPPVSPAIPGMSPTALPPVPLPTGFGNNTTSASGLPAVPPPTGFGSGTTGTTGSAIFPVKPPETTVVVPVPAGFPAAPTMSPSPTVPNFSPVPSSPVGVPSMTPPEGFGAPGSPKREGSRSSTSADSLVVPAVPPPTVSGAPSVTPVRFEEPKIPAPMSPGGTPVVPVIPGAAGTTNPMNPAVSSAPTGPVSGIPVIGTPPVVPPPTTPGAPTIPGMGTPTPPVAPDMTSKPSVIPTFPGTAVEPTKPGENRNVIGGVPSPGIPSPTPTFPAAPVSGQPTAGTPAAPTFPGVGTPPTQPGTGGIPSPTISRESGTGGPATTPKPVASPSVTQVGAIERTPTTSYDVDIYQPKQNDTWESISREYYNDPRYAAALKAFNANASLSSGAAIDVPPIQIVRNKLQGQTLTGTPPRPAAQGGQAGSPAAPNASWSPSVNTTPVRQTSETKIYRVPAGGADMRMIARTVLGDGGKWEAIYNLNLHFRTDVLLPEGTEVRVPANANVPN